MFLHYLIHNWQHVYENIQCIFYTMENAPLKSLLTKPRAVIKYLYSEIGIGIFEY